MGLGEMVVPRKWQCLAAQAWLLGSMELTLSSVGCDA